AQVRTALLFHLTERGWTEEPTNARGIDVVAKRGAELLKAEVKGTTSDPGTDIDILFGQALRMLDDTDPPMTTCAATYWLNAPADVDANGRLANAVGESTAYCQPHISTLACRPRRPPPILGTHARRGFRRGQMSDSCQSLHRRP